jgi:hypothetical protein
MKLFETIDGIIILNFPNEKRIFSVEELKKSYLIEYVKFFVYSSELKDINGKVKMFFYYPKTNSWREGNNKENKKIYLSEKPILKLKFERVNFNLESLEEHFNEVWNKLSRLNECYTNLKFN